MQPVHEGVHAREGEEHHRHRDHEIPGHEGSLPPAAKPQMQVHRVDDPGDERPDLLGVPGPEGGPGLLGPDRAREDDNGEKQEAEGHHTVT